MTTPQPAALPEPLGWYVVNNIGMATLCKDEAEAQLLAEDCDMVYQRQAPHRAVQLAALQSQPAAPLRLDQIDLVPLKAELSDPAKAKAFLQKHGFLNASGELAEQYGGKPEQPAAAGVSDAGEAAKASLAVLCAIRDLHAWHPNMLKDIDFAIESNRHILALRPQSEPVGEAGTMPGTSGFTMACFHADKVPVGTKLYADALRPQAVPMTEDTELLEFMFQHRAVVSLELEGGWDAELLDESGSTVSAASGFTPRDALRRLKAHHGITAQGAQGEQG